MAEIHINSLEPTCYAASEAQNGKTSRELLHFMLLQAATQIQKEPPEGQQR